MRPSAVRVPLTHHRKIVDGLTAVPPRAPGKILAACAKVSLVSVSRSDIVALAQVSGASILTFFLRGVDAGGNEEFPAHDFFDLQKKCLGLKLENCLEPSKNELFSPFAMTIFLALSSPLMQRSDSMTNDFRSQCPSLGPIVRA